MQRKRHQNIFSAVGRRKTAIARVQYISQPHDLGDVVVNNKKADDYFPHHVRTVCREPFALLSQQPEGHFIARVTGGGPHAQAEALRHGIARVLVLMDEKNKPLLKARDLMRRDPRMKERKKPGLKRARRAPQWSKR